MFESKATRRWAMARLPRFTLPGVPQHIIQRGNNREPCFYAEEDYGRYRQNLTEAANKNKAIRKRSPLSLVIQQGFFIFYSKKI